MKDEIMSRYNIEVPTLEGQLKEEGFKRVAELEARADGRVELPIDLVPNTKGGKNIFGKPYAELRILDKSEINPNHYPRKVYVVYQKREESPYVSEQE